MKIITLKAENVKRIKAVSITPQGSSVVIGGNNGQGKSSLLDSIFMALVGKKAQGAKPVRDGEGAAKITIDLGEYKVVRTIKESGDGTVKVTNAEGAAFGSPQKVLDGLCSTLSFDPLSFMREKPAYQLNMLKELVGVDFSVLDKERGEVYSERTGINRQGSDEKSRLDGLPVHENAPKEEVSVSELLKEKEAADSINKEFNEASEACGYATGELEDYQDLITKLEGELVVAKSNHVAAAERLKNCEKELESKKIVDTAPIIEKVNSAETDNRIFRENKTRDELSAKVEKLRGASQGKTDRIKAIDAEKSQIMSAAEFPVDGLMFAEDGITYNGIPFSQCSSAEQLKVSVGMGIAMNPKLKLLLIRDGSLLDDSSLAAINEMAEEADAQVWIERVGKGGECSVIISDGEVEW